MLHLKQHTKEVFDKMKEEMKLLVDKSKLPSDFDVQSMSHVALLDYALYIISCGEEPTQFDCDLLVYVFDFPVEIHELKIFIEKDPAHKLHADKVSSFVFFLEQIDKMTASNHHYLKYIKNVYENIGNSFVMAHGKEDYARRGAHKSYIKMLNEYIKYS